MGNYCKYEDKGHPYLKLQPLKLEVLLDEPMVHVYHDVVSDKDIAEMKRMASKTVRVYKKIEVFCTMSYHEQKGISQTKYWVSKED